MFSVLEGKSPDTWLKLTHTPTYTKNYNTNSTLKVHYINNFQTFYVSSSFKMKYNNFVSDTLVRS